MAPIDTYSVFLSSTSVDLHEYRGALTEHVAKELPYFPVEMGGFGAIPKDPVSACIDKVAGCDFLIGIYAFRYGHVPDGEKRSITEIEFDTAKAHGKRCLCFVADESLRPLLESADESAEIKERLRLFKEKVGKQVVWKTFASIEDLKEAVALTFNQFLAGDPTGFFIEDVVRRWQEWQAEKYLYCRSINLLNDQGIVDSPLARFWDRYRSLAPWHETIIGYLNDAAYNAQKLGLSNVTDAIKILNDICDQKKYYVVTEAVISAVTGLLAKIQDESKRRPLHETKDSAKERDHYFKEMTTNLRRALHDAQHPQFEKAFLVMGSIGSGKTHFLAGLLEDTQDSELMLPLEFGIGTMGDIVLNGLIEATGMHWRSLEEFHRLLEPEGVQLVVAIDDLQDWQRRSGNGFEKEMLRFMAEHTSLHNISWLFTLKETSYDAAITEKGRWEQYGYIPEHRDNMTFRNAFQKRLKGMDGWLMVDELNREDRTGLKMIELRLSHEAFDFFESYFEENPASKAMEYQLTAPFFASLFIDMQSQVDNPAELANLHHIDLVEHFWDSRSECLARILAEECPGKGYVQADVMDIADVTAGVMARKTTISPLLQQLLEDVADSSKGRYKFADSDVARIFLKALIDGHLLAVSRRKQGVFGAMQAFVELHFEIFWRHQLARRLLEMNEDGGALRGDAVARVEQWFETVQAEDLKEGVVEFLLLNLDRAAAELGMSGAKLADFWKRVLDSRSLPSAAVWFAAAKSRNVPQGKFIEFARASQLYPDRHLIFSFMYYAGAAVVLDQKDLPPRLELLQRHYRDIAAEGNLGKYFTFVLSRVLNGCDSADDVLSCIDFLSGCEVLGITEDISELVLARMSELLYSSADGITGTMQKYLQAEGRKAPSEYGWFFTQDEFFLQGKKPRELRAAFAGKMKDDNAGGSDLEWLNRVLKRTDLLKVLSVERKQDWPENIQDLVRSAPRPDMPYEKLAVRAQIRIRKLNRMVIQHLFPGQSPRLRDQWQRYFFREWLLCSFSRWITAKKGPLAFYYLSERSWYSAGDLNIHDKIGFEMEREANIAVGNRFFKRRHENEVAELHGVVEDLVGRREPQCTETAFHIIRHTTRIFGRNPNNLDIHSSFHPMLRKIYLSPNMDRTRKRYRDLFRNNLSDFDSLEKRVTRKPGANGEPKANGRTGTNDSKPGTKGKRRR